MGKALKKSQKSLKDWGEQDWDYVSKEDKKKPVGQRGRYLPKYSKVVAKKVREA